MNRSAQLVCSLAVAAAALMLAGCSSTSQVEASGGSKEAPLVPTPELVSGEWKSMDYDGITLMLESDQNFSLSGDECNVLGTWEIVEGRVYASTTSVRNDEGCPDTFRVDPSKIGAKYFYSDGTLDLTDSLAEFEIFER